MSKFYFDKIHPIVKGGYQMIGSKISSIMKYRNVLIVLVLIISLCGCTTKTAKEPFHIGMTMWSGYGPFFLAKEKGFFGDLPVELDFIDTGADQVSGLYAGRFQMLAITIDMFLAGKGNGEFPSKIIFAIDHSVGGDAVVADKSIKTVRELKGKKVITAPGDPNHLIFLASLRKAGLTVKDLNHQDAATPDAVSAFIAGKVDAAGAYQPYTSMALQKRKGAHILASSKDFPYLVVDVGMVTDKILNERKADVAQVYDGWCKAVSYMKAHPSESNEIMAKAFKLTSKKFGESLNGIEDFGEADNRELFDSSKKKGKMNDIFNDVVTIMRENHMTDESPSPESKISTTIVSP